MRENNRKSIARIGKLPQFTTMNVIDGQAVQGLYASLIFYSLTIDNILNIIVLLILAGVAISTLAGNDNILKNAETAVDKYNEKAEAEEAVLNTLEKKLIEFSNGGGTSTETPPETEIPPEELIPPSVDETTGLATAPYTIYPNPEEYPNLQIVIPVGFAPAILEGSNSTTSLPGQSGKVVSIMQSDKWSNITAEQINQGIVIVDHEITYTDGVPDFNEYVWVPIPESSNFARTKWITPKTYDENGNWISGGNTTIKHHLEETATSNYFWEDKTTSEYINMVNSITSNKGFYISRYEACSTTNQIAQSKRGVNAYATSITRAITCSENNATANTHLIYGIEWDSVLNWLIDNATISSSTEGETKTMRLSDIQTNSSSWGNYADSTGDATKVPYKHTYPQKTGASEYWKANNIYDLAGNYTEWTQEKYSTENAVVYRGMFHAGGGEGPVATRLRLNPSNSYPFTGFRYSFYL